MHNTVENLTKINNQKESIHSKNIQKINQSFLCFQYKTIIITNSKRQLLKLFIRVFLEFESKKRCLNFKAIKIAS